MARATPPRRSKHRGNAAGMIEARGRTGRKPSASEKRGTGTGGGGGRRSGTQRQKRHASPPAWKGAGWRAVIAAAVVYAVSTLLIKHTTATKNLLLLPIVLGLYRDRKSPS